MTIVLDVDLDGHPPGPNRRMHYFAKARASKEWRGWTYIAALAAIRSSGRADDFPLRAVTVEPIFFFRSRRNRDEDNLFASLKPLLDGLVDAKVVPDDNSRRLSLLRPRVVVGATIRPGIRLRIKEAP